jgi:hypothetical protein
MRFSHAQRARQSYRICKIHKQPRVSSNAGTAHFSAKKENHVHIRSPPELGTIVKGSEVQLHTADYNQLLWNLF